MKKLAKLGEGAYGSVYSVSYDNKKLAVKRNSLIKETDFCGSVRELDLLFSLKGHPYIISLEGISFGSPFNVPLSPPKSRYKDDNIYFVLEHADVDLHDLIYNQSLSFETYKLIVVQSLLALEFIHGKGILHRDIKPSNLLWKDNQIKLCDFGLSKYYTRQGLLTPRVITAWYRSPEVFIGNYSYKADIWSLGCVLTESLAKKPLFQGTETIIWEKLENFKTSKDYIRKFINLSDENIEKFGKIEYEEVLELLEFMLKKEYEKRLTAKECLALPFCKRQESLINSIREKYPSLSFGEFKFSVHDCFERKMAVGILNDIYNDRNKYEWYTHRILFNSLFLFDRYLDYMHKKHPKGLKNEKESGKFHSEKGAILRYLSCLYLCVKYFTTLYVPGGFFDFLEGSYKDVLMPKEAVSKSINDFEKILIKQVCSCRLYYPTPYETVSFILQEDEIRLLLFYYGSIGNCTTTSKKIIEAWKSWLKRK